MWPTYADQWPIVHEDRWTPPPGHGATVCLRSGETGETVETVEILRWDNAAEARDAARLLYAGPCSPRCGGVHLLLYTDEAGGHVARIGPPPPPPTLADELAQCYPTTLDHSSLSTSPAYWPRPTILNQALNGASCPQSPHPTTPPTNGGTFSARRKATFSR
jgi:hypothetical protein